MLPRPPPLRKEFLARSTKTAASDTSKDTDSVPVSMRATSSRSVIRLRMWSACLVDDPVELEGPPPGPA